MTALFHFPRTQNERIAADVRRQLMWQTDIQSENLHVEVDDSTVTLTGHVETRLEKREAENATKAVYGVASVHNQIEVRPHQERSDREIEDELAVSLDLLCSVLEEAPAATVKNNIATLKGRVRWHFQRQSAERAADSVVGVREVVNLIEVGPPAPPCRQIPHKRLDTTPASVTATLRSRESHSEEPLFVVPGAIGRA